MILCLFLWPLTTFVGTFTRQQKGWNEYPITSISRSAKSQNTAFLSLLFVPLNQGGEVVLFSCCSIFISYVRKNGNYLFKWAGADFGLFCAGKNP